MLKGHAILLKPETRAPPLSIYIKPVRVILLVYGVVCQAYQTTLTLHTAEVILKMQRGVEQWQLVGLITRRSLVRIQPPLLFLKLYRQNSE